jgi:putative nucleotidyltransferase with HDIG domain
MRRKLLDLLPDFQLIREETLREKSLRVWLEAVEESGWSVEDLLVMPFTLLIRHTPVNIIEHTRAVTRCSAEIGDVMLKEYGDRIALNRDYLISGALLHDVGKLFEYEKQADGFVQSRAGRLLRHPISGASFAARFGIPNEILHIIAAHSREGDGARRTVEAVIVNHADFINFESLKLV